MNITEYSIFSGEKELVACTLTSEPDGYSGGDILSLLASHYHITSDDIAVPGQVHGSHVQRISGGGRVPGTDATVSFEKGVYHSLRTADCIPLFLFHPPTGKTALVHAGWRGLTQGIASEAMKVMDLNSDERSGVKAALGPAIRSCCYEVKEDVAVHFPDFIQERDGRLYLSLQDALKHELIQAGLSAAVIEDVSPCTSCRKDKHYSFRATGTDKRMISLFGMKKS